MALIGGGGAGNVAGGNPSGTGSSINYVGNHLYGFSGLQQINTVEVPHMDFSIGAHYVMAVFTLQGGTKPDDPATGKSSVFTIKLNDEIITSPKVDSAVEGMPSVIDVPILLPPYCRIIVTCQSPATTVGIFTAVIITGRVYA